MSIHYKNIVALSMIRCYVHCMSCYIDKRDKKCSYYCKKNKEINENT